MTIKEAKILAINKYKGKQLSDVYFVANGKIYSAYIVEKTALQDFSIDLETGVINEINPFEPYIIAKKANASLQKW